MAALDEMIADYINESFTPYKRDMINSITEIIEDMNNLPNIDVYYNFPYVNAFLTDLITEDSLEVDIEDKKGDIERNLKKTFIGYLEAFGVLIDDDADEEITLLFLNEMIKSLQNLFMLEVGAVENILAMLDNEDDENKLTLANILADGCELSGVEIYSILGEISDEAMSNLRDSLEKVFSHQESSVVEDMETENELLNLDEMYGYTKMYNEYINNKKQLDTFTNNVNYLYTILNSYNNIDELLLYGVYEVLFLLYTTTEYEDYQDTLESGFSTEHIKLISNSLELCNKFNANLRNLLEELRRIRK